MSAKQAFAAAKLIHKGISSIKPEHIQQAVNVAQQVAGVLDPNLAEGLGEVSDGKKFKSFHSFPIKYYTFSCSALHLVMNLHNEQVALVHGMAGKFELHS